MSRVLGQQFIVENVTGAGGSASGFIIFTLPLEVVDINSQRG
jgi:hypothetical protein